MMVYYKKPFLQEDGKIVVEQVTQTEEEEIAHGILKCEILIVKELYPNMEVLKNTIEQAHKNYNNPKLQADKTVGQLEMEKKALEELKKMVKELKA